MTEAEVRKVVLSVLSEVIGETATIRSGGSDSGSWCDYALDAESLVAVLAKKIKEEATLVRKVGDPQ